MNQPLLLLVAALAVLLVYAVQRTVRRRAKLRRSLDTAPSPEPELAAARRFWESFQKHRPQPHAVDDLTWDDLDMDSVFTSVNCCRSGAGSLWLYTRLRLQLPDVALPSGEDPVEGFSQEDALCRKMKYRLALLGPHGGTGAETLLFDASSLQLPYARFAWLAAVLPFASFALWPLIGVGEGLTVTVLLLLANFMACIWLRSRPGSGFPCCAGFRLCSAVRRNWKNCSRARARTTPRSCAARAARSGRCAFPCRCSSGTTPRSRPACLIRRAFSCYRCSVTSTLCAASRRTRTTA